MDMGPGRAKIANEHRRRGRALSLSIAPTASGTVQINHLVEEFSMRVPVPTRRIKVAISAVAILAVAMTQVASMSAAVIQGLAVSKGCESPTAVGSPYACQYIITNSNPPNPSQNTLVVTAVSDSVAASGGAVGSGNILSSLSLTLTGGATCVGGGGTPYVGATACTLPFGGSISSADFSFYTVVNGDYALSGHQLADTATVTWHSLCDVTGASGCNANVQTNQGPGASDITPGSPAITTSATGAAVGGTITDHATITGLLGTATGNIVFTLFGPSASPDCSGAPIFTSAPFPVSTNTGSQTVGPANFSPAVPVGSYYWIATFTDTDGGNLNATTTCGADGETSVVSPATPTLTTTASGPVVVGATITDTAHLGGGFGTLSGTISFNVYAPGDTGCVTPLAPQPSGNTVSGAGDYTSGTFTTAALGDYLWIAHYSGDVNNNPVDTNCGDPGESSTVGQNPSIAITKLPHSQTIESGGTATWTIVVTNTGNVPLTNVNVTDPNAGDCVKAFIGTLAVGASETAYTCTLTGITADMTNTATAHGTPPVGGEVTANDSADVHVIVATTTLITKSVNPGTSVVVGTAVTITLTETNTGNDTLSNVSISSSTGCTSWTPANVATLASLASVDFSCTFTPALGANAWSATATATDSLGNPASSAGETASGTVTGTPPPSTGAILPTNTECTDFVNNTTPALPGIFYSVTGAGKIGQNINPGVFFYYTFVQVTAGQTVTTSQHATNGAPLFSLNQGHVWVYTANCDLVAKPTQAGTTVTYTFANAGTYVFRIQYSTKSIAGLTAPSPSGSVYTFDINGTDNASVPLILK
jgi:hypothetical protein